jgi:AcrR family transcriptional regulator
MGKSRQMAGNRRLSKAESQTAALKEARALLIEFGPQAVTLKAVADRVGRTHANLLHHFGSASGLQKALAKHMAETVCASIAEAIIASRTGLGSPRAVVDLAFDAFDKEGAGALASWMLLSGNEDALDPIVDSIHDMVVDLGDFSAPSLRHITLALTLMALGDAQLGERMSQSMGLERTSVRDTAEAMLIEATLKAGVKLPVKN